MIRLLLLLLVAWPLWAQKGLPLLVQGGEPFNDPSAFYIHQASPVNSVAFSPDGTRIVSGSKDHSIKLWDAQSGKLLQTLTGHTSAVSSVAFSPDGTRIVSGSMDNSIRLWDAQSGKLLQTLTGDTSFVSSVAFSPDGTRIVSGAGDNSIKLWDAQSGKLLQTLTGHTDAVLSVAFSPDGTRIVAGAWDKSIKLWDAQSGALLQTLTGHSNTVTSVAFSPDGTRIVSGAWDNSIKLWDVQSGTPAKLEWTLYPGDNGCWAAINARTNRLFRGDDGTFVYSRRPTGLVPANPPWLMKEHRLTISPAAVSLSDRNQTRQHFKVQNLAPGGRLYWLAGSYRDINCSVTARASDIAAQSSGDLTLQATAHLPRRNPRPVTRTILLPLVTAAGTEHNVTFPLAIRSAQIAVTQAYTRGGTLIVELKNVGDLPLDDTATITLLHPFKGAEQLLEGLEVNQTREFAYTLPEDFTTAPKVRLDVAVFDKAQGILPLYAWDLEHPLTTEDRPIAYYLLLALVGLLLILLYIYRAYFVLLQFYYWRRFRPASLASFIARRLQARIEATGEGRYHIALPPGFDLELDNVTLLLTPRPFSELEQALRDSIDKTLIIGRTSDQAQFAALAADKGNRLIAPTGRQLRRFLLTDQPQQALVAILLDTLPFKELSPYQTNGGIKNESNFFGRRELVKEIVSFEKKNYLIVGARQLGKSTILEALHRRYASNPTLQSHLIALDESGDLLRKMGNVLDVEADLDAIMARIESLPNMPVFLIDEADTFIKHEKAGGYRITSAFRSLAQEGKAVFVMAGFWTLYYSITYEHKSPLKNFGEIKRLEGLEAAACRDLMIEPMRRIGIRFENDDIITALIQRCGYRANLIAIICDDILTRLERRTITQNDVETAISEGKVDIALSGWDSLEDDPMKQRIDRLVIYTTLQHEIFRLGDVVAAFEAQTLDVDINLIQESLSRLTLGYILKEHKKSYTHRVPLLKEYLLEEDVSFLIKGEVKALKR